MQATIYFIELTQEEGEKINAHPDGWGSPVGRRYLSAKNGQIDGANFDVLVKAATGDFNNAKHVWRWLQNLEHEWRLRDGIECHTEFPRSMDVGDIIVWEDGRRERCAATGFEKVV